jgi:hypothetical protein
MSVVCKKLVAISYLLTRGSSPDHFIIIGLFTLTILSEGYKL